VLVGWSPQSTYVAPPRSTPFGKLTFSFVRIFCAELLDFGVPRPMTATGESMYFSLIVLATRASASGPPQQSVW
jgi:hypothetical protein